MIPSDKKTLVSKQYEYWSKFFIYVTNRDCKRLGVLLWLVAVHYKFTSFVLFLDEFLGDVASSKKATNNDKMQVP